LASPRRRPQSGPPNCWGAPAMSRLLRPHAGALLRIPTQRVGARIPHQWPPPEVHGWVAGAAGVLGLLLHKALARNVVVLLLPLPMPALRLPRSARLPLPLAVAVADASPNADMPHILTPQPGSKRRGRP